MKNLLAAAVLMALSVNATAQTNDASKQAGDEEGPSRWALGAGAVVNDSPYAGEGLRVNPFPLVVYEGDRFYFRGITAGWRFITSEAFELAAVASLRLDGFDIEDLGKTELANNGLDYRLLDDRDNSVDAGLSATWRGAAGELEIELVSDVTDTSGGQQASIEYGYPIQWGKTRITPSIGVTWMSEDTANYYYGTLDTEVARGVVDYKPDAVTIPTIGVMITRDFGKRWSMIAMVEHSLLPDEIQDSPLLEPDSDSTFFLIGVARGF